MTFVNFSGFGFKFDLKSGYHHIEIHPDHQKYLGFSWQYGDTVRYFTFSVLPFGLSSAGHIFTKTVRVLVKYWRSLGFPMVVYLDDGMGTAENFDTCFELSKTVKNDLLLSGFIANTEKSVWEPVQNIDWLGFVWNFKDCTLEISLKKLFALKLVISSVVDGKTILTYRCIAKICGKIISMIPALGNVCQMMTKHMHMLVCCRSAWDDVIPINDNILKELKFWYFECESLSFQRIVPINRIPQRVIFTDASQYAGAGFIMNDNKIVHFMFDGHERSKSSTWRELKTVEKNISSFKSDLTGKFVKLYTDNQNVVQIVKKGSMKVELLDIALSLFHICLSHNIFLDVEWIPRDKNTYADYLSKIFDYDDWGVSYQIFICFDKLWGPFTCDRFADSKNKKVDYFNSRYYSPDTSGVDAFAYDWSAHNNWLVPPVCLVSKCLNHMRLCKAKGTLVVPKWPSALFWPILVNRFSDRFKSFVIDFREYVKPMNFFTKGSQEKSIFAQRPFNNQWKQFECYANDSRFASIIRDLPSFVESSRSNSTIKKYKCYFKKFEKCLRSGGASTGANRGVSDRLLKVHGRWASDKSKDGYIKDNLKSQMAVSLNLGI
ncbi:uncharacterized protein LOC134697851 [Mytilus trossulus]|uniref:uncharacterized protein LOC134697851 n=1 Tax=Mytilus trossulus TaxID=6551 RepID=UPI0030049395